MKLKVLSDAEEDLLEGYHFYEEKCPGLRMEFLKHLDHEILRLKVEFARHPRPHGRYHRAVVQRRFPYAIYYTFDAEHIFIHMVFDCPRDPGLVSSRLGSV